MEPEVNLLNDIQLALLLDEHRDKQSCIQHEGGHQGEMSVIVEVIISHGEPVNRGESGEARHVGLGPVKGVEAMPAPHQHPITSSLSSYSQDFLDNSRPSV